MTKLLMTVAIIGTSAAGFVGCGRPASTSTVKTDLGEGNDQVYYNFYSYQQKTQHCVASGSGKRVIVTGFGLFTGVAFNISGVVESSFADAQFTPAALLHRTASQPLDGAVASGLVPADALGGVAVNRAMTIGGTAYDICFLTLDVLWDQAGSIIVYEANQFKPQMIYMTGRNSEDMTVFEEGAANKADTLSGYNSDGTTNSDNTPIDTYILNPNVTGTKAPSPYAAMTWDNTAVAAATKAAIGAIGYPDEAPTTWRFGNDYLCNNVSYIVLSAAQGVQISLAGDELSVPGDIPAATKIGFMHFPSDADNSPEHIHAWVNVMATAIKTTLP